MDVGVEAHIWKSSHDSRGGIRGMGLSVGVGAEQRVVVWVGWDAVSIATQINTNIDTK